jgi:hypothetical protein
MARVIEHTQVSAPDPGLAAFNVALRLLRPLTSSRGGGPGRGYPMREMNDLSFSFLDI